MSPRSSWKSPPDRSARAALGGGLPSRFMGMHPSGRPPAPWPLIKHLLVRDDHAGDTSMKTRRHATTRMPGSGSSQMSSRSRAGPDRLPTISSTGVTSPTGYCPTYSPTGSGPLPYSGLPEWMSAVWPIPLTMSSSRCSRTEGSQGPSPPTATYTGGPFLIRGLATRDRPDPHCGTADEGAPGDNNTGWRDRPGDPFCPGPLSDVTVFMHHVHAGPTSCRFGAASFGVIDRRIQEVT